MRGEIDQSFLTLKFTAKFGLPSLRRLAPVLAILAIFALSSASAAHAQTLSGWSMTGWVSAGTIQDLTGNAPVAQSQPLLAGHSYNLTLTISVPNTSTSTKTFSVSLNPKFIGATNEPIYWAIHTASYPGYNKTAFTSGDTTVTFNYDQGTLRLSAYFQVPVNFTIPVAKYSTPGGNGTITLHVPQSNVIIASVVPLDSTGTGSFSASVEDQSIATYQTDYNQTANLIPSGKISSTYSTLVNALLSQAQALDKLGLPTNGTALLNTIVPSSFPTPPSSSLQTYLLGGLAVAVILVVVLAVLNLRSRGRSGYSAGVINDVQKELAVLEVTAAKYDRAMADKLKSLRDKLSESS